MTCPICKHERGCGCGFKLHPVTNTSVCSSCYELALQEVTRQQNENNVKKPAESTNES